MSFGIELLLSVVSAVASVGLTAFVGAIAWYLKGEYREHKKNTAVRRWLVGDPALEEVEDVGQIDEIEQRFGDLRDDMDRNHAEVQRELHEVKTLTERIAAQLEAHDGFSFTRGGSVDRQRQRGDPSDD